jgi:hypothetical protein
MEVIDKAKKPKRHGKAWLAIWVSLEEKKLLLDYCDRSCRNQTEVVRSLLRTLKSNE